MAWAICWASPATRSVSVTGVAVTKHHRPRACKQLTFTSHALSLGIRSGCPRVGEDPLPVADCRPLTVCLCSGRVRLSGLMLKTVILLMRAGCSLGLIMRPLQLTTPNTIIRLFNTRSGMGWERPIRYSRGRGQGGNYLSVCLNILLFSFFLSVVEC